MRVLAIIGLVLILLVIIGTPALLNDLESLVRDAYHSIPGVGK